MKVNNNKNGWTWHKKKLILLVKLIKIHRRNKGNIELTYS